MVRVVLNLKSLSCYRVFLVFSFKFYAGAGGFLVFLFFYLFCIYIHFCCVTIRLIIPRPRPPASGLLHT